MFTWRRGQYEHYEKWLYRMRQHEARMGFLLRNLQDDGGPLTEADMTALKRAGFKFG